MPRTRVAADAAEFLAKADQHLPKSFGRWFVILYMYLLTGISMLSFVGAAVASFTFSVLGSKSGDIVTGSWLFASLGILALGIVVSFLIANSASGLKLGRVWGWRSAAFFTLLSCIGAIVLDIVIHVEVHNYHTLFDFPVVLSLAAAFFLFLPSTRETVAASQHPLGRPSRAR